jgi:hypothetical protein
MEQRDGLEERPVRIEIRQSWPVGSLVFLLVFAACQYSLGGRYRELVDKDVRIREDSVLVHSSDSQLAEFYLATPKVARLRGEPGIRIPAGSLLRITDVQCKYGIPGQFCYFIGVYEADGVPYRFTTSGFLEENLRRHAERLWEDATSSEQDGSGRQSPR